MKSFGVFLGLSVLFCSSIVNAASPSAAAPPPSEFDRALQLFGEKNYTASQEILQKLSNEDPEKPTYWFNLGNADFMLNQFPEALEAYGKVIELGSPLSPAAHLYLAKCLRKQGDLEKAENELSSLKAQGVPAALRDDVDEETETLKAKLLEQALSSYKEKDYSSSIPLLQKSAKLGDEADVELLLGSALFYEDKVPEARAAFVRTLQLKPDATTRSNAEYFLNRIQEALTQNNWSVRNPYWLSLDVSGGYNTNVFTDGNSLPSQTTAPMEENSLTAGYIFFYGNPFFIRMTYFGNWEETVGISGNRATTNAGTANITFQKNQWLIIAAPTLQYQTYGGFNSYLSQKGGTFRLEKLWGEPGVGFSYQYLMPNALNPTYSYLTGNTSVRKLYYIYNSRNTITNLDLVNVQANSGDQTGVAGAGTLLPSAYHAYGLEFDLYWFMSTRWDMIWNTTYLYKSFPTPAQPTGTNRVDNEVTSLLKFEFRIAPSFKIYASGNLDQNFSTMGSSDIIDKNYTQVVALGGFTWDILR